MKQLILLALLSIGSVAQAAGGTEVGGGGKGVVCRNSDGTVRSVELLDLWEARTLYGRQIQISDAPVAEQVSAVIKNMSRVHVPSFDSIPYNELQSEVTTALIEQAANVFLGKPAPYISVKWLRGTTLTQTDDSFEDARPTDCAVEQIATYKNAVMNSTFLVNHDLFDKMDKTNQAALIIHEAFYSAYRSPNMVTKSSVRARRAVGYLFAGGKIDAEPDATTPHQICHAVAKDSSKTKSKIEIAFFDDRKSDRLVGAVISGFDEQPIGYYPIEAHFFFGEKIQFDDLFAAKKCPHLVSEKPSPILSLRVGGPSDFDKSGTIATACTNSRGKIKLKLFWVLSQSLTKIEKADLVELECK